MHAMHKHKVVLARIKLFQKLRDTYSNSLKIKEKKYLEIYKYFKFYEYNVLCQYVFTSDFILFYYLL